MDSRKYVLQQSGIILAGELLCSAVMVGIFALMGKYDTTVLLGALFGSILASANFFFMAIGAMIAADKAEAQNVKGGQATISGSYALRLALLFVIMFALLKAGVCNPFALVLPLVFTRPILTVSEFFRKPGEPKQ